MHAGVAERRDRGDRPVAVDGNTLTVLVTLDCPWSKFGRLRTRVGAGSWLENAENGLQLGILAACASSSVSEVGPRALCCQPAGKSDSCRTPAAASCSSVDVRRRRGRGLRRAVATSAATLTTTTATARRHAGVAPSAVRSRATDASMAGREDRR